MNKTIYNRILLLLSVIAFVSACAKISAPTGGVRDRKPPFVVKSIPLNRAVNFNGKKVVITFDEFIELDNIADKFMVSPPMKKKPRILRKGKNVEVAFDEKLKDSTTYTFYFQDAIKDLNEGNILNNFQFVFSTGKSIDTLSVTGNVYSSLSLEAPEKTIVLMYHEMADSAVRKHLPDYIARVRNDGYFRIDNVRQGNYRLYALKDDDNSKNYNYIEEEFAFMDTTVTITPEKNFIPVPKDTVTVKKVLAKVVETEKQKKEKEKIKVPEPVILTGEFPLILFKSKKKDHYLTASSRDVKYLLFFTLSLPPDSLDFKFSIPGVKENSYFIERSRNRDSIKVWITDSTVYSNPQIETIVQFPFTDTLGVVSYKQDTIPLRFVPPRAPRVAKKKQGLPLETNIGSGLLRPGQKIVIKSQTPFSNPDTSRIRVYETSDSTKKRIPYRLIKDNSNACKYVLDATFAEGKKYLFIADSASFGNIYNEYSDSTGTKISLREPDSFGKVTMIVSKYEGDRIIQLLSKSESVISEVKMKKDGKAEFPMLEPGFYRVRVIYDLNGDGTWTTGDFDIGRQPEPVSYYKDELEIKSGREIEQDWNIGTKNNKDPKLREKLKK